MSKKDLEIRGAIEGILENDAPGRHLQRYFDALPDARVRRAVGILSGIYPDKTAISDDDFQFVVHLFSERRFLAQASFCDFVRAVGILDFTGPQRKRLIAAIQDNIELLCDRCTYELDALLAKLLEPDELIRYLQALAETASLSVLQRASDILRHEDFSSDVREETIEALKGKISQSILAKSKPAP